MAAPQGQTEQRNVAAAAIHSKLADNFVLESERRRADAAEVKVRELEHLLHEAEAECTRLRSGSQLMPLHHAAPLSPLNAFLQKDMQRLQSELVDAERRCEEAVKHASQCTTVMKRLRDNLSERCDAAIEPAVQRDASWLKAALDQLDHRIFQAANQTLAARKKTRSAYPGSGSTTSSASRSNSAASAGNSAPASHNNSVEETSSSSAAGESHLGKPGYPFDALDSRCQTPVMPRGFAVGMPMAAEFRPCSATPDMPSLASPTAKPQAAEFRPCSATPDMPSLASPTAKPQVTSAPPSKPEPNCRPRTNRTTVIVKEDNREQAVPLKTSRQLISVIRARLWEDKVVRDKRLMSICWSSPVDQVQQEHWAIRKWGAEAEEERTRKDSKLNNRKPKLELTV